MDEGPRTRRVSTDSPSHAGPPEPSKGGSDGPMPLDGPGHDRSPVPPTDSLEERQERWFRLRRDVERRWNEADRSADGTGEERGPKS
jgi:hypothetical protein